MSVGTLDTSRYIDGTADGRFQFARDLVSALNKDGYAKLRNQGISYEDVREIFSWVNCLDFNTTVGLTFRWGCSGRLIEHSPQRRFFNLSVEEKISCIHKGGTGPMSLQESLNIGPLRDTSYPNQWIAEKILPAFREHVESYYTLSQETSNTIFEAIELGLNLPLYPYSLPHTDFGTLSLLFQDSAGGLEFEDRSKPGTFVPVTSEDTSDLIVTMADILQRWTNDVLKAGLHRVSVPRQFQVDGGTEEDCILPDRYSLVFFCRPSAEKSAGPIHDFVSEERPANYDEISALEHLERRNRLVY
ncbi:hypothetical protein JMJ35_006424 [Cladonia borealis]|uniref:Fe2OG dioxygenase domain-containing protein n=1 Tax=Cladonia borealis TaxID=184061 RepID=A0AA39QX54_9LECA|nr:hypothetical protein JMJ35_006424 [Cladonia borealis]